MALRPPFSRCVLLTALTLAVLSGCAASRFAADTPTAEARDVPDHFLVGHPAAATTEEPAPDGGCRNPMVDPRDATRLTLVRSNGDLADYEVPPGRYGVGERELLRLACGTGRAVGIVRRKPPHSTRR